MPRLGDGTLGAGAPGFGVVEVASSVLQLDLEARNGYFVTRCPVHDDHNPSMTFKPDRNTWRCWTCRRGGGPIELISFVRRCSLEEARRIYVGIVGGSTTDMVRHMLRKKEVSARSFHTSPDRQRHTWQEVRDRLRDRWWWIREAPR